jgi:hypothetical protein
MTAVTYWKPERQPGRRACEQCKANPDKQVLPGHDGCLPPIGGRYTADVVPVPVTEGLRVWDYNLRPGTVVQVDYSFEGTPDGPLGIVSWHLVETDYGGTGMFDGTRLWTRHPIGNEAPPPGPPRCEAPRDNCPNGPRLHNRRDGCRRPVDG